MHSSGWIMAPDIGIDLGTANTLVYRANKGIVIDEPSVVAVNKKTGQIVDVGKRAKEMLGRTPSHIKAVKPLVDGVISHYEVAEEMMAYLLDKAGGSSFRMFGPRVVVGIPPGVTNVERQAVKDATKTAGAREVYLVEEPMLAAIGIGLAVDNPAGHMVIDIGGGTTDVAIVALQGSVISKSFPIAGDRFDADIISYVRKEHNLQIGQRSAEELKITAGSLIDPQETITVKVRGRNVITGLPKEITLTDDEVRYAIARSFDTLIKQIRKALETAPPEVVSDVLSRGVHVVGGGAQINGIGELLQRVLSVPVHVSDDPLRAVVRGTGVVLENFDHYKEVLINDDELPLQQNDV